MASVAARVAVAVASIITVPILLGYLGVEGYGLWVTAATLMAWVNLGQVGIPMSLLNRLAATPSDRHHDRATLVATAWWVSVGLAALSLLLLAIADAAGLWSSLFDATTSDLQGEAQLFVVVMWIGTALIMPLLVPTAVLRADQEVDKVALVILVAAGARLAGMLFVIHLDAGAGWLVVLSMALPLLVYGIAACRVLGRRVPWPNLKLFQGIVAASLLATGVGFVGMSVATLATTSIDVLLVAQILGPSMVPTYSVPFALLVLFMGIAIAVLDGFWPAYTRAASEDDRGWIRKTSRAVTAGLVAASIVFAVGLVLIGATLIEIWAGPQAVPPTALLVVFGATAVLQSIEVPHSRVLVATGHVRQVTTLGLIAAAVNVPVSIVLGLMFGVTGIAAGTLVAYLVIVGLVVRAARDAMSDPG